MHGSSLSMPPHVRISSYRVVLTEMIHEPIGASAADPWSRRTYISHYPWTHQAITAVPLMNVFLCDSKSQGLWRVPALFGTTLACGHSLIQQAFYNYTLCVADTILPSYHLFLSEKNKNNLSVIMGPFNRALSISISDHNCLKSHKRYIY